MSNTDKWKSFKVYPDTSSNVLAKYRITEDGFIVKLVSKVPQGQFYSVLNDALSEAANLINS